MSPDIVKKLVDEAGFDIIKCSLDNDNKEKNIYYARDILLLLKAK